MATNEHKAALKRLSRLRLAGRLAFVGAIAMALVAYFAATRITALWPGGLVTAILFWMLWVKIVERLVQRTRCPNCHELFFRRPEIGSPWQKQENCAACRFNVYRGNNIRRES